MQAIYTPDIWVSSHAGQFNPARFGDLSAYKAKIVGIRRPMKSNSPRNAQQRSSFAARRLPTCCTI